MKIGVYVCHCGRNIAGTVNVAEVVEFARSLPYVVVAKDYRYICSDPGQEIVSEDIARFRLDRAVFSCCSPRMNEPTFRRTAAKQGLNPYCLERANIREQCSWVHSDTGEATAKAKLLVAAAVSRVMLSQPLVAKEVDVVPAVLVIGGGIAGIQAALDLGRAGFKVYLVEREPCLGGHAARLDKVFPTLDDAAEMVNSRVVELKKYPNIDIMTSSQVVKVEGFIGNFKVNIKQPDRDIDVDAGTIIVATGYDVFDARKKPEYGYGVYPNVITGLELEKLSQGGKILVNGKEPKNVVFIQCVGSRDKSVGNEYCSRVCCMYTAKQAGYIKSKVPSARVTVCYIDVRAFGKGCEQFYEKVQRQGVIYRRGAVSEVYRKGEKLLVRAEDTLLGEFYEEEADLVVLATGLRPAKGAEDIAKMLHISQGADGFFLEAHLKLAPVETTTDGIVLAGCAVGPKDITDSVSQGHAAAVKACIPLLLGKVVKEPLVPHIDEEVCAGCQLCENACEFGALTYNERSKVMTVNEALCRGCGACSAICPSGANQVQNATKKQFFQMIAALT